MPPSEVHCKDCLKILGKRYKDVHRWMDSMCRYFPPPQFLDYHRSFYHNSYGLAVVKSRWGSGAMVAGEIHLLRDYDDSINFDVIMPRFNELIRKALMWFNNLENMEFYIEPDILNNKEEKGWMALMLDQQK